MPQLNSKFQKLNQWINERWPLAQFLKIGLHEEIPGGSRFSYALGSAALFLFIIQTLSGIWQMFYYVPTVDYAYSSLSYLRFEVAFGWLIHGFHYWGAQAFTVVVGLHVIRVFIWGAYKKPRELVWLAGVVLLILTAAFMFTGPILAWDKKGYWAGEVGLNMTGSIPFLGPWLQSLLQGASKIGQIALTRQFVLHVAILPFFTILFVVIHLVAFRVYGSVGPWKEEHRKKSGDFWPEQLFKDALVAFCIFVLLVGLSVFSPAPVAGLADPMDTLYTPKPEWNFLFLYECLKYFSGPLEPIGTVGIPLLIILLLISLPFMDRSPERNPFKRGFVLFCGFGFLAFVFGMTLMGYYGNPPLDEQAKTRLQEMKNIDRMVISRKGIQEDMSGVRPPGAPAGYLSDENISGEKLFRILGCAECHSINGKPSGKEGPDLKMVLKKDVSREWLWAQLVMPEKHNPHTPMPTYGHLSDQKLNALIDFLQGLVKEKSQTTDAQAFQAGEKLFRSLGCIQCHTVTGKTTPDKAERKIGPDLKVSLGAKNISKDWLRTQLVNPKKHHLGTAMPSFAHLADHQLEVLIVYLDELAKNKSLTQPSEESTPGFSKPQEEPVVNKNSVGQSVHIVGNQEHGMTLFQEYCMRCHGPEGKVNPSDLYLLKGVLSIRFIRPEMFSKNPQEFIRKIDPLIQHGIANKTGGPDMPNFGDTHELTQSQIADIEAYVLKLNGVDRAQILNPGVEPRKFFYILIILSILMILVFAVLYSRIKKSF